MTFAFTTSPNVTADTFWEAMRRYMKYFATFVDAGAYGYFLVTTSGPGQFSFSFNPFWGGNMTRPQLETLVKPFLNELTSLGIPFTPVFVEYDSMYQAWNASYPPENVGVWNNHAASRLFPRDNFADEASLNATLSATRYAVEKGGILVGYNIKAAARPDVDQDNAVNPAWRKTLTHFILVAAWAENATNAEISAASKTLTEDWMVKWRSISPGAGSYMSEGDINEPNFQQAFYGTNYDRLLSLKKKYDPDSLFYAPTAVGSEDWYITNQEPYLPTQNGRLCRKT
jgi:hypothetical protein